MLLVNLNASVSLQYCKCSCFSMLSLCLATRGELYLLEWSHAVADLVSDSHPYAHLRPTCQKGRDGDKGETVCLLAYV